LAFKEFYATADLSDFERLQTRLSEWEFYYNWHRPHGSLNGDSPNDKVSKLSSITPFSDEVYDKYKKRSIFSSKIIKPKWHFVNLEMP
jgi:hypothetical protein